MALKTALIISGDASGAQKAVSDLRDDVDNLGKTARGTSPPLALVSDSQSEMAKSARTASGAIGELAAGQRGSAATAREVATAHGVLGGAIASAGNGVSGFTGRVVAAEAAETAMAFGTELLTGALAGLVTGGISLAVAAAVGLITHLIGLGDTAEDAGNAADNLASRVSNVGDFFDTTTGKIKKSSAALIEFAILSRQQEIQKLQKQQATSMRAAAGAVRESGQSDTQFLMPTATRGARLLTDPGSRAITDAVSAGNLTALRRLAEGNSRQAKLAATVLQSLALKDGDQAKIDQLRTETLALATGKLAVVKDEAGHATARHTAQLVRSSAAIAQTTSATDDAAEGQSKLAGDLSGVIARYDPARKAASDYADELARINRLVEARKVDPKAPGLSEADGERYIAAADNAYLKVRADAFSLPDVEAAGAASKAIDAVAGSLRGEIAALTTLDPIAREMLKYHDDLARLGPDEKASREAEIRGLLAERTATENTANAAREAAQAKRELLDAARGALDAIIVGGEKASDVVGRLAKSLASAAVEAAVFGTGPLATLLKGGIAPAAAAHAPAAPGAVNAAAGDVLGKSVSKGMESGLDRIFGSGKGASALKQAGYGAAAAGVAGGNSLTGALGGAIGGQVAGKLLSTALGSFAGPFGSIVGGVLGGAIGGLFTKTKSGSATIGAADGSVVTGGNSAAYRQAASGLAGGVQDILGSVVSQLGGSIGAYAPITIGKRGDDFRVNLSGTSLKTKKGAADFNGDEQAATLYAAQAAIARGAVQGLSTAITRALQSSNDLDKAVAEALKVRDIETLVGGIAGQIDKAFRDFEDTAKERVRIAQQYGFDVVAIEKRNADDRAKIANDLVRTQVGSLQTLLDEMQRGSLFEGSALDRVTSLNEAIGKAQTELDAGVDGAGDTLAKLLQDRLGALKDAYGTTGGYADGRAATADLARAAIARTNAQIAASQAKSDPALATTNAALDENNDQNAAIIAALRDIDMRLAGTGSAGGTFDKGLGWLDLVIV